MEEDRIEILSENGSTGGYVNYEGELLEEEGYDVFDDVQQPIGIPVTEIELAELASYRKGLPNESDTETIQLRYQNYLWKMKVDRETRKDLEERVSLLSMHAYITENEMNSFREAEDIPCLKYTINDYWRNITGERNTFSGVTDAEKLRNRAYFTTLGREAPEFANAKALLFPAALDYFCRKHHSQCFTEWISTGLYLEKIEKDDLDVEELLEFCRLVILEADPYKNEALYQVVEFVEFKVKSLMNYSVDLKKVPFIYRKLAYFLHLSGLDLQSYQDDVGKHTHFGKMVDDPSYRFLRATFPSGIPQGKEIADMIDFMVSMSDIIFEIDTRKVKAVVASKYACSPYRDDATVMASVHKRILGQYIKEKKEKNEYKVKFRGAVIYGIVSSALVGVCLVLMAVYDGRLDGTV